VSAFPQALQKAVSGYMFTDGFVDQFGGPAGKKFMKARFKKLLSEHSNRNMSEQKKILDRTITKWMGQTDQIDDILVIGIRIQDEC